MDASLRRRGHGRIQSRHRGPQVGQGVQAGHHGALRERLDRQEDRRGTRRALRRSPGIQAPNHRWKRQGRIPDAARPARSAAQAAPPQRGRGLPPRATWDAQEEDGPRERRLAGYPAIEPEDRPARPEIDRGRVAGADAMKVPGQPEVNIGVVGHVDHGKSTLTERLTGERTDRHSEEIKRGISIRLGYADMAIYRCPRCEEPQCYSNQETCKVHDGKTQLQRIVSFVDSPGHETLMATMLSGAAIMDGALLVIAANEDCPQPQTKEHLMALNILGIKNIIIIQNKIDIVPREKVLENYNQIKAFVKGTVAENAPIIPVSAQQNANIDLIIEAIEKYIPTPVHEMDKQ